MNLHNISTNEDIFVFPAFVVAIEPYKSLDNVNGSKLTLALGTRVPACVFVRETPMEVFRALFPPSGIGPT